MKTVVGIILMISGAILAVFSLLKKNKDEELYTETVTGELINSKVFEKKIKPNKFNNYYQETKYSYQNVFQYIYHNQTYQILDSVETKEQLPIGFKKEFKINPNQPEAFQKGEWKLVLYTALLSLGTGFISYIWQ